MYHINHMPRVIELGTIGDNHFKTIEIDMTPWLKAIPRGVASIIHIRPGETQEEAYITGTDMVNGVLMWEPVAGDLGETEGYGSMQIWLEDAATNRGKSVTVQTFVRSSIVSPGEIPQPQENWMEQMTALKVATVDSADEAAQSASDAVAAKVAAEAARDAAQAAAGDFQGLSATATGLAAGANPTINVTHIEDGVYNFAFGIPKGDQGIQGIQGEQGETGATPDISIGTVTTLPAGSSASAIISGTAENPVLSFSIPRGDKGETGDPAPSSEVTPAVNTYLETYFSNPSNPPLDRSLLSDLSAAPADMVGILNNALNAAYFTLVTNTSVNGLIRDTDFQVAANEQYFIRYKRPSIGTVTSMRLYGKNGDSWDTLVSTDFVDEGFVYTFTSGYAQLRFWLSCAGLSSGVTTDVLIIKRNANSVGQMVLKAADDQDINDVRALSGAETNSGFVNGSLNGNTGSEITIADGTRLRTGYLRSYPGATQTISIDNTQAGISDAYAIFYGDKDTSSFISVKVLTVGTGIFKDEIPIPAGANYLRVRLDGTGLVAADYSCTLRFTGENGERLDDVEDDITDLQTNLSSANANAIANRGNIGTADLNLNSGDFIHPGRWAISNMTYEPKFYPTEQPGTVISFASTTDNPFGTYQIIADQSGNVYRRYGGGLNNWYSWSHDIPFHHDLAFVPAFTKLEPLVNSYTINRDTSETGRVANLYALYNAVTDPEVKITKDVIGQSAAPAGNTSEVYTIYNYKVSLKNNTTEKPAVLLVVGEHGDELNSAMVGYYAFREIVTGCLKKYLTYVDFWVVPLMNPYGYEHKQRNNANDVNLNRDFPCEWAYSDTAHNKTGNYSLSQPESMLFYNLLVNNKDKILFMCNKHNTGDIATKISNSFDGLLGYVSTVMQQDKIANNGIAGYQNKQVHTTDPWVTANYTGSKNLNAMRFIASRSILTPGTLDLFANSIGIHGSLLEVDGSAGVPIYGSTRYTDCARFELDFFVNWIAASIEQNHIILSNDNVTQKLHYYTQREVDGNWVLTEQYWNGTELIDV